MAYIGFSYLAGLMAASFISFYLSLRIGIAVAALAALSAFLLKPKKAAVCVCLISFGIGAAFYSAYGTAVYRSIIKYDGADVIIEGGIADCSELASDKAVYTVKGKINGDVTATVTCFTDSGFFDIGDAVTLSGRATKLVNSYDFPSEDYYKAKGIYLRINSAKALKSEDGGFSFKRTVRDYKNHIYSVIKSRLSAEDTSVMTAMLFGDKSYIEDSTVTLMFRSGIGHIMAVSGVHMSAVCSFMTVLFDFFKLNKKLKFILLFIIIFLFASLADMSNSVMRAGLMILIVYGAELFRRRADALNSLGIAVILLTLPCPFAVRDASFLLSVGGTFSIAVAAPLVIEAIRGRGKDDKKKRGRKGRFLVPIRDSVISSACTVLIVFPVSFMFFEEISIISPLTNLILIPLCTIILICGVITALTFGVGFIAFPLLALCGPCCKAVIAVSRFAGGLEFAYIPVGFEFVRYGAAITIIMIVISALVLKDKKSLSVISCILLIFCVLSIPVYRAFPSDGVSAAVLGDGKSSALIIHDKKTASVIDLKGGGKQAPAVRKYLNSIGIRKIDAVIFRAGSLTAHPAYLKELELFDTASVLFPEGDYLLGEKAAFGRHTMFFDPNSASIELRKAKITMSGETVSVAYAENAPVAVSGGGAENENIKYTLNNSGNIKTEEIKYGGRR